MAISNTEIYLGDLRFQSQCQADNSQHFLANFRAIAAVMGRLFNEIQPRNGYAGVESVQLTGTETAKLHFREGFHQAGFQR